MATSPRLRALASALITLVATVLPSSASAATTRLEAESATLSGGAVVQTDHTGYTGSGFVGGYTDTNRGAATTSFTWSAPAAGTYSLNLRYANGTGSTRTLTLRVGGAARQVSLPATANWDTWATAPVSVPLATGTHTFAFSFGSADNGNVNLDHLDVASTGSGSGPGYEAENATLSGGAVVQTDHTGYTGSGFVGGYTDANRGTARTTFRVTAATAGQHDLAFRLANGTGSPRTLSLYVDGTRLRQVTLPTTAGWDTWTTSTEQVQLSAGQHDVALAFDAGDSGNLNLDSLTVGTAVQAGPGEAESAFLSGGTSVHTGLSGYSGSGYVAGFGTAGARVVRTIKADSAGTATVTVRFQSSSNASLALTVNGRDAGAVSFPAGSGWRTATATAPVRAGLNTVGLSSTSAADVAVDSIAVSGETALAQRGATLPYTTYEAEDAVTNGTVLAASRTYRQLQSEASGRRAVVLDAVGEHVTVRLTAPANGLVLRYSLPDSADGAGLRAPISLYANGTKVRDVTLTSEYSWVYGDYPYFNDPALGGGHRFFDETRVLGSWAAGTELKFQVDTANGLHYVLDFVEAEPVAAPATAPANAVSITSHGAVPDNGSDATAAITAAIAEGAAQNRPVWVPAGTFRISSRINAGNVRIIGAGPWHSVIQGTGPRGGFFATGKLTIADLAIFGDVRVRLDNGSDPALEGNFGTGSLLQNVWVEHTKVGLWADNGTTGLYGVGLRIRNTFADGVNLHGNVVDSRIDQSTTRNNGDDGLAMWSGGAAVTRGAFTHNTVQLPAGANGIAVYGGADNRIEDNHVADIVTSGSGIAVSTWHQPVPFSGTTSVRRNTLLRAGSFEPNWNSAIGALWIYTADHEIRTPVVISDLTITDSSYQGVLMSWQKTMTPITFDRLTIDGATWGFEIQAAGSGTISNTRVTRASSGGVLNAQGFALTLGGGNSGI
ncbi:Carbohydrate binding module (family 35) [Lentzea fradiae]|uniref:Carbohydrate binding module (Family 35) n=1 Tax=Lentzea fradiae TaxID=200378 RepID=A0A1G7NQ92_9PSEU|nr:CBM35 domain-containing protein [Lentzea fradiae]SDF76152.1 Carbohydrate binding module (family 35) [Lentzea fradiae]